jgi:uncharacterized protein
MKNPFSLFPVEECHMRETDKNKSWWRYGHVWLVISGPLVVVVAALITAVIAFRQQDPVLAEDYYKRGIDINKTLQAQEGLAPAGQARNHAATPVVVPTPR